MTEKSERKKRVVEKEEGNGKAKEEAIENSVRFVDEEEQNKRIERLRKNKLKDRVHAMLRKCASLKTIFKHKVYFFRLQQLKQRRSVEICLSYNYIFLAQ